MRKKQPITKDEAKMLLQSQPLSARLWQLASDSLDDNAIRFPDPSYLDSHSWPDSMSKKYAIDSRVSLHKIEEPVKELHNIENKEEPIIEGSIVEHLVEPVETEFIMQDENNSIESNSFVENIIAPIEMESIRENEAVPMEIESNAIELQVPAATRSNQENIELPPEIEFLESSNVSLQSIPVEDLDESLAQEKLDLDPPIQKIKSIPKRKSRMPQEKEKKEFSDANDNQKDLNGVLENDHAASTNLESLDFYEWLEELKESKQSEQNKQKLRKTKGLAERANAELKDAKTIAENSLILGDEIVSETLARLLARQGHNEEAIEMYQKLILKYPEKGATFAAALQKLKS